MRAAGGSPLEMPYLPRFSARRSMDTATAEALLEVGRVRPGHQQGQLAQCHPAGASGRAAGHEPAGRQRQVPPAARPASRRWCWRSLGVERGRQMVAIRSRWHDGGFVQVPRGTRGKQAALAYAPYGLRLQAEGISPGPIEATVAITDKHGHLVGQLDLDARDAQWMVAAVSAMLRHDYGPWRRRTLVASWPSTAPASPDSQRRGGKIPRVEVHSVDRTSARRSDPGQRSAGQECMGRKSVEHGRDVGQKGTGRNAGSYSGLYRARYRLSCPTN